LLSLDPQYTSAYLVAGASFTSDQQPIWTRRWPTINRAIISCTGRHLQYNDRRDCYLESGKNDLAMADFNQAILHRRDLHPGLSEPGTGLYQTSANTPRRLNDFNHALELDPNNSQVFLYRGLAYNNQGNYKNGRR